MLEQQHGLASWIDHRLIAGDAWDQEIRSRLEAMDIFLFIASQTSLVRPYIRDTELRRARERREAGEVEIVAVKLEPCACDEDPYLKEIQRLAGRIRSVAETKLKSSAWEQVRKDLLPVIERVRQRNRPLVAARLNETCPGSTRCAEETGRAETDECSQFMASTFCRSCPAIPFDGAK